MDVSTMTYKQICNRLEDIRDDLQRLNSREDKDGGLLHEDQVRFAELTDEFDELFERKGRLERDAALLRVKQAEVGRKAASNAGSSQRGADDFDADPLGEPDSVEQRRFRNPWATDEIRAGLPMEARTTELRSRALTAIEQMQGTTDRRREAATRMVEQWDTKDGKLSAQVLATSSPEYLRAFGKLAATSGRAQLSPQESEAVQRAMSLTDAEGGYLVPFQLDPSVILSSDGSLNEVRQIARKVVATGDKWHGVSAGAVSWSFDAEAAEVSDDSPTFAQPEVDVHTARGFVPISLEASMDASNVAQEVGALLAQGKDDLEAEMFINGTGTGQPFGILTILEADAATQVDSAALAALADSDVYAVHDALAARFRSRASWLAANGFYSMVRQLDANGGSALWERIGGGRPSQLIGRNVAEAEAMPATLAANASLAIIGDFSHYVIADRVGMTVEFIPHLMGASGRPKGQRGWFAYYRVGANSTLNNAFRLLTCPAV